MIANHGCPALKGYMPVGSGALIGQELLSVVSTEDESDSAPAILLSVLLNRQDTIWALCLVHTHCDVEVDRSTEQVNANVWGLYGFKL